MRGAENRELAFDRFERHFLRFALCLAFPGGEQLRVRFFQIAFNWNVQALGCGVNPLCLAFNFAKVPDRCFVNYDMAGGVGPFTAKLFVAEAGTEAYRFKDRGRASPFSTCDSISRRDLCRPDWGP